MTGQDRRMKTGRRNFIGNTLTSQIKCDIENYTTLKKNNWRNHTYVSPPCWLRQRFYVTQWPRLDSHTYLVGLSKISKILDVKSLDYLIKNMNEPTISSK